jgi:hypothetical protein
VALLAAGVLLFVETEAPRVSQTTAAGGVAVYLLIAQKQLRENTT